MAKGDLYYPAGSDQLYERPIVNSATEGSIIDLISLPTAEEEGKTFVEVDTSIAFDQYFYLTPEQVAEASEKGLVISMKMDTTLKGNNLCINVSGAEGQGRIQAMSWFNLGSESVSVFVPPSHFISGEENKVEVWFGKEITDKVYELNFRIGEFISPVYYDYCMFNMDRGMEWFTFLQDGILEYDPNALTSIKAMPDLFVEENHSHGINFEAMSELTTILGDM